MIDSKVGLVNALRRVNDLRRRSGEVKPAARRSLLEETMDDLFAVSHRLAIYGSLAPGESNHSVIEDIRGTWSDGFVRGHLHEAGWGATTGYPAMTWDPEGGKIAVALLVSPQLPAYWKRLDEFEGDAYIRLLVPVENDNGVLAVANIYALCRGKE